MSQLSSGIESIEKALNQGQIFLAHNIASEMLMEHPEHFKLVQLNAIALNRLNQPEKSLDIILRIINKGKKDGETMGILGRTFKDLYKKSKNTDLLRKSAEAYFSGYINTRAYYPAINAASLFYVLGDKAKADQIAKEVIEIIGYSRDYWSSATLGEAYLLMDMEHEAIMHFEKAITEDKKQFGKFQSTYAQLSFLSEFKDIAPGILELFPKPNLAVFSGHMIDDPGRKEKRFPAEIEEEVKLALKHQLEALDIDIGFTSLASGGDIIFAELLKERNAEIKAYLPFRADDFISTSVSTAGLGWINRFENCYDCNPKLLTSEPYLETPALFQHLGKVMMGECLILSEQYDTIPSLVTVLAPNQINKAGGTKDLLDMWPYSHHHHNVDPARFFNAQSNFQKIQGRVESENVPPSDVERKVSNILFADIVGFSKLLSEDTPKIILSLLKNIRKLIHPYDQDIEVINTWGDAIIICHPEVESIFKIALGIQHLFTDEKDRMADLPPGLNIRIALHTGPAFFAVDPLTGEPNVYGTSVNRAARMEPVTIPGSIYASDQFAACLKLSSQNEIEIKHVGIIELPKGFGKQEVYQISNTSL